MYSITNLLEILLFDGIWVTIIISEFVQIFICSFIKIFINNTKIWRLDDYIFDKKNHSETPLKSPVFFYNAGFYIYQNKKRNIVIEIYSNKLLPQKEQTRGEK